jgi:hypothetical protein
MIAVCIISKMNLMAWHGCLNLDLVFETHVSGEEHSGSQAAV